MDIYEIERARGDALEKYFLDLTIGGGASPIEVAFYAAWIRHITIRTGELPTVIPQEDSLNWYLSFPSLTKAEPERLFIDELNVIARQAPIARFKADFLIGRLHGDYHFPNAGNDADIAKGAFKYLRRLPPIVVECDGHDFHERTKEQAAHDRNRDREMTTMGIRVMRFTGSEIYKDVRGCVDQVEALLDAMSKEPIDFSSITSEPGGG